MELLEYPANLNYTPNHMWVRAEGNRATIGITEYGQMELGMLLYAELPELNAMIQAGESLISAETAEKVEDFSAPVSGVIVAINTALEKEPFIVNMSPYAKGWLVVVEMSNLTELEQLWSRERYQEHCGI
jgi:glycine cleavage system H protein